MRTGHYFLKLFFGAIGTYLVLDYATGTEGILKSGASGGIGFTQALQGRASTST